MDKLNALQVERTVCLSFVDNQTCRLRNSCSAAFVSNSISNFNYQTIFSLPLMNYYWFCRWDDCNNIVRQHGKKLQSAYVSESVNRIQ